MRFRTGVHAFLTCFAKLQERAQAHGDHKSWRLKPKSHFLAELARDGVRPSLTWTYLDESFGGGLF